MTQFGVNVPENLTVVGYDDIEFSSMSSPALSTVHVPRNDSGVLAMDYLDALLRHGANAPQVPARLANPVHLPRDFAAPGLAARRAVDRT
ncbi:substrate-binding domain-containing protein [Glutamicibacter halophytocola]|uniref:substrate-binding domain-containing protein n=1 Tax=Glutamicibacter halophytocola TaxID=1933880 RepID=UPI003D2CAB74